MSTSPTLHHSCVDQSLPGSTDKRHTVDNSRNPACTQCIYPQRIQDGRSNILYLSHTENSGLQRGYSHRAKKRRNKEKTEIVILKKKQKTKPLNPTTQPKTPKPRQKNNTLPQNPTSTKKQFTSLKYLSEFPLPESNISELYS